MYPETLDISSKQVPYFRTEEFSELMLESERLLKGLLNSGESSKVAFLTASGTGAMDAAVSNFFTKDDKLLVISGGSFGKRFEEICSVYHIPYDVVEVEFGQTLCKSMLEKYDGRGYTGLLVNIDETSVGQLYDLPMISDFCRKNGMYLVVDAISSFLADPLDMGRYGVDAVIISSQKALALAPGISAIVLSERLYRERVTKIEPPCYYLNIRNHIDNQVRGQTPFTPAVGILIELNDMLKRISEEGLDRKIESTHELAEYFRKGAKAIGLKIPEYPLSNAVTPLVFDGNAYDIFLKLKEDYGIVITPSGGSLKGKLLRVGHIGNLKRSDYDALLDAMKKVI